MKSYKNIALCFQYLGKYKYALIYLGKMLRLAWYLKDMNSELKAYDYIGVQYYYLGKLDKAKYYHTKMLKGESEPNKSDLKRLGISKVENALKKKADGKSRTIEAIKKLQHN